MHPRHGIDPVENKRRMLAGDMYYAATPELGQDRLQCALAMREFNQALPTTPRRQLVEMWLKLTGDHDRLAALPLPVLPDPAADSALFEDEPWVEAPVRMDYGYNVRLAPLVYVNAGSTWIDTCTISIGTRTLIGPNCSFYSGDHPLSGKVRNGTRGPESGKPITIGADCWLGGNVVVLSGVTIGDGSTVGAGSVVTKDVPPGVVVAGNPARFLKKAE